MLSPDPSTLTNGSIYLVFENEMSPGRSSETSTLEVKGQQHFGSNQWQPPFARSWLRQVRSACLSGWNKGGMGLQETRWNSCSKGYLQDQLNGVGEVWQWVFWQDKVDPPGTLWSDQYKYLGTGGVPPLGGPLLHLCEFHRCCLRCYSELF